MASRVESLAFADRFKVTESAAREMIDWMDHWRLKSQEVGMTLCGAPTSRGHPCQQPRKPGLGSGCHIHPNWRLRLTPHSDDLQADRDIARLDQSRGWESDSDEARQG